HAAENGVSTAAQRYFAEQQDRNPMIATEGSDYQLRVPDGELHIRDFGTGTPVVLLHGGALDSRMWEEQIPVLTRAGYRVAAFDARGHGQSTLPTTPFRQCDDVAAIVRHLDDGPAVLVGLSMGGASAVDTALEHPGLVRAVVAVGSGTTEPAFAGPFVLRIFETWQHAQENNDIEGWLDAFLLFAAGPHRGLEDRKSTRLNSSHVSISYAVFCLNTSAPTDTYTLSLHDALPISGAPGPGPGCCRRWLRHD